MQHIESEEAIDHFNRALDQIRQGLTPVVSLVTFATDGAGGVRRIYSPLIGQRAVPKGPSFTEEKIDAGLTAFVASITGEPDRKIFEQALLEEAPDQLTPKHHRTERTWRFNTLHTGVELAVTTVSDDHGETARTWSLARPQEPKRRNPILPFLWR
ncbi:hypothetical protein A2Y99_03180 [Candidatus Gottesmanbacteria bacterium RBG_13_37_7]|uniref:Uncharacterized protein n=1 Tax=Candidatus Gottesmanbacteria bacterium RBG_13_37_7 TaxID=1798369 RepID=A0A1F5YGD6_9BACT|nr:MAG: hypothetical protein A2Y99_03180 [Candidatus Gottesmanbacteria bacterium RBG_13_37_7]